MRSGQITDVEVIRVPLRSKFRGVSFREALIFKGSERYAEFSPFLEYEDQESSNWLRAAIEFANTGLSKPIRNKIEVNATLPAVTEDEIAGVLLPFGKFEIPNTPKASTVLNTNFVLKTLLSKVDLIWQLWPIRLRQNARTLILSVSHVLANN